MGKFIYVIFDVESFEIWSVFTDEKACIECYSNFFDGFLNVRWMAVNVSGYLRDIFNQVKEVDSWNKCLNDEQKKFYNILDN